MSRPRYVLSFVEDGWRSARVLSIALVQEARVCVVHFIKGRVDPAVLRMVTPYPGMRIVPIERLWFKVVRWLTLIAGLASRRVALILVDNDRTWRFVQPAARRWGVPVVLADERYQQLLYQWNGESIEASAVVQHLRERRR